MGPHVDGWDDDDETLEVVHSEGYERYMAHLPEQDAKLLRLITEQAFESVTIALNSGFDARHECVSGIKEWIEEDAKGHKFDWLAREKSTGDTLLHKIACVEGAGEMIDWAIAHGANPNARKNDGSTVLHNLLIHNDKNDAISYQNVIALTDKEASLLRPNEGNDSPKHWAQFITAASDRLTKLMQACYNDATRLYERIFQAGTSNALSLDDINATQLQSLATLDLHHAAMHPALWQGKEDVALRLLRETPPYLQDELVAEMRGLMEQAGVLAERPLKNWVSAVSGAPAEARARA